MRTSRRRLGMGVFCAALLARGTAAATYGLSVGYRGINYSEADPPPEKSNQTGGMTDFSGYAEKKSAGRSLFARAKVEYATGNLLYDGTTQATGTPPSVQPVTSTDKHNFWVYEGLVGVNLNGIFRGAYDIFLYSGLNYKMWYRNLGNPAEVYKLLTLPVGLRFEPLVKGPLAIGLDVSARALFQGTVDVSYTAATGYDAQSVPLGQALGVRAELPIRLLGGESGGLVLTPWFELSKIRQGTSVPLTSGGQQVLNNLGEPLVTYEPSSRMYQYGASLAAEFTL